MLHLRGLNNFKSESLEGNLYLRIVKFGTNHPDGFSYTKITEDSGLALTEAEKGIVDKYLDSAYLNSRQTKVLGQSSSTETPFLIVGRPAQGLGANYMSPDNRYIINFDAQFKYIDYLELRFAREYSAEAKRFSILAIIIALISLLVPIVVAIWMTQTIRIEEGQLREVESRIQTRLNEQE